MRNDPDLGSLLYGNTPRTNRQAAPTPSMEGTITSVGEATAKFVLPDADGGLHEYGPAMFGRTGEPPQVGDQCLVVFVGNGIDRAWIVAWNLDS